MRPSLLLAAALPLLLSGCPAAPAEAPPPPPSAPAPPPPPASGSAAVEPAAPEPKKLDRGAFNRGAIRWNLPLHWVSDGNRNGEVDPDEVASLLFFPGEGEWVKDGKFTDAFRDAYRKITAPPAEPEGLAVAEVERRKLVAGELDGASPSLVRSDLRRLSDEEKAFARRMLRVAGLIDELYAQQLGVRGMAAKIPADDLASQSLFRRNWGPRCQTPGFDRKDACTALPGGKPLVSVYPAEEQASDGFCKAIEGRKDARKLLEPFTVVSRDAGKKDGLKAEPYTVAYREPMKAISDELKAAAEGLKSPAEKALKAYLEAAAKSFLTNDWFPADDAWAKMNAQNSAWYVRVGPDETYWEPCNHKAGFHLTFARINPDSLRWQDKLKPVQQEMEDTFASLVGAPYKARKVSFHLPDFIDITVNAGDDRSAVGATIGQSLPNWGPIAAKGKGRTVAMTNLYTDPDSQAVRRAKAESLLGKATADVYTDEAEPGLISTILHEAAHNLGPAHEYRFKGKKDADAFGGELSSMLEELKAQTSALWYVSFLLKKGIITAEMARKVHVDSLVWAFNHVSRGMWTAEHKRKPYSQLSAIQIGFLLDEKALVFDPEAAASNGKDRGAYVVDFDRMPAAVEKLMKVVGSIKASNNKAAAEALAGKYVDGLADHHARITERCLRHPQPNFVYAVDL